MTDPELSADDPVNAIAEIRKRLSDHPDVRFEETSDTIEIFANHENGFDITLVDEGFQCTVAFDGGWHEHFQTPEEAVECVGFGLSDACRLRVELGGIFPQRWIVECFEGDSWHWKSETGLMLFPFWRRKKIVYRQNTVLKKCGTVE